MLKSFSILSGWEEGDLRRGRRTKWVGNIRLCSTSHISTIPPDFETQYRRRRLYTTLSIASYKYNKQPDPVNNISTFHPLSTVLLATVPQQKKLDASRLTAECGRQPTGNLVATIGLSLPSPIFQEPALTRNARGLLGVAAFFPQGDGEKNVQWLLPTIPNVQRMFDEFCALLLAYESNGFITILAPLRDYLHPKDPT